MTPYTAYAQDARSSAPLSAVPAEKSGLARENSYTGPLPEISASLDRREILPGETITFVVVARWKAPLQIHPLLPPREAGKFETLNSDASPVQERQGESEQVFTIALTSFEAGEWELPPFEIPFLDPDGVLRTARTDPQKITVHSYIERIEREKAAGGDAASTIALRGIKPPLEIPMKITALVKTAAIILGAIAALAFFAFFLRRWLRSRPAVEAPDSPPLPPDQEALQALARLELEDAAHREKVKVFYSKLSEILRRYLGRRYAFDALEMTSSELLGRTRSLGWQPALLRVLEDDFSESDSVKFARYAPSHPSRVAAIARARRIVLETRPVLSEELLSDRSDLSDPSDRPDAPTAPPNASPGDADAKLES